MVMKRDQGVSVRSYHEPRCGVRPAPKRYRERTIGVLGVRYRHEVGLSSADYVGRDIDQQHDATIRVLRLIFSEPLRCLHKHGLYNSIEGDKVFLAAPRLSGVKWPDQSERYHCIIVYWGVLNAEEQGQIQG